MIRTLWTKNIGDSVLKKILWSLVLFIPVFGWIFYGAFYNPPAVQPRELQGRFSGRGVGSILLSIKGKKYDDTKK
jgi:hypothetical protein